MWINLSDEEISTITDDKLIERIATQKTEQATYQAYRDGGRDIAFPVKKPSPTQTPTHFPICEICG